LFQEAETVLPPNQMQNWNRKVLQLMDESETPNLTKQLCETIFQRLARRRIRDPRKFQMREGPEFSVFMDELLERYPEQDVKELLYDDSFFTLTYEVARAQ
jgi:hypothetical protein